LTDEKLLRIAGNRNTGQGSSWTAVREEEEEEIYCSANTMRGYNYTLNKY
jgi:hypothetical protein